MSSQPQQTDVSIVIPVYNESENVANLVRRVGEALLPTGKRFELICIDDGSSDDSAQRLADLAKIHDWLRPLYLMRNYGQTAALQAGFEAARGKLIVTLDGDLQNDPDDIPALLTMMAERPDVDMISGWRKDRKDKSISRKLPSKIANGLISWATGVELHDYGCALKVYRCEIIHEIKLYGELHRFIPALAAEVGAKIIEVPVRHHARTMGTSKYGIDRTFRVILDLVWIKFLFRFLHRPLHAFGGVGLTFFSPGILILLWLAVQKFALGASIGGRPLLLVGVMLVLIGVQLVAMGVLGEILIRIYHEPEGRAQYRLRDGPRAISGAQRQEDGSPPAA
ncbi:MAG: glycosyltransferase family 2 protein [Sulfurimicrobium sp.]|nr:glycosyltransferase family 2 protein [Sulfurimicrobium sp.]